MGNKMNLYNITTIDNVIKIHDPNETSLVYRFPYSTLENKQDPFAIKNDFIVYILYKKSNTGKDIVYVGKSTTGIYDRTTSHLDKSDNWDICYIITCMPEADMLNDTSITLVEDMYKRQIDSTGKYDNKTEKTSSKAGNWLDIDIAKKYFAKTLNMLYCIGADFLVYEDNNETLDENEDKNYESDNESVYNRDGKIALNSNKNGLDIHGYIIWDIDKDDFHRSTSRNYITCWVCKGSEVGDIKPCLSNKPYKATYDQRIELENNNKIVNGKLIEDVEFTSPSRALSVMCGNPVYGGQDWKLPNGKPLNELIK